jgi:hypothetical protein
MSGLRDPINPLICDASHRSSLLSVFAEEEVVIDLRVAVRSSFRLFVELKIILDKKAARDA